MWQEPGCPATVSVDGGLSQPGEVPPGESPILPVRLVVEQGWWLSRCSLFPWNPCTSSFVVTIILVHPTITFTMIAAFPHRGVFETRPRTEDLIPAIKVSKMSRWECSRFC